ncbi:PDR/VanB family oxidoreductase [Georgenia sp. SYP-B2076]|uniref:PDR/VanB family oxidoreductase n=1 Tax=Georgenia sp. SYP-B2076 TaxID=2495881 RepID=UPI000F8F64FD|nr:PDR/VanB family oxidoreductase [Georgenia sp. SYP-B2076]
MTVATASRVHHETDVLTLTVAAKRAASDCVAELVLTHPDGEELPAWLPGAHLDVHLPCGLDRQYSLCGSPSDRTSYRLAVLREPAGRGGSQFVHDELAEGIRVEVSGPNNHFELVTSPAYRFLAAGVGVTPLMPMVEAAEAEGAEWSLTYLGRSRSSMAFWEELSARYPGRVEVRPDDEQGVADLPSLLGGPREGVAVYACGPEGFLRALEAAMEPWPANALHVERFAPKDAEALSKDRGSFTVKLAMSDMELEVPEDKSIVDVLEQAGVPVIYSCMEGTCGTCETQVLCGEIDHRDSILSDEEKAENSMMMICVSRAKSPVLELDL